MDVSIDYVMDSSDKVMYDEHCLLCVHPSEVQEKLILCVISAMGGWTDQDRIWQGNAEMAHKHRLRDHH